MTKAISCDLLTNVVGSYDQTKTTIQGRVASQTYNSATVLSPIANKFIDVQTDAAIAPVGVITATSNGRLFLIAPVVAGTAAIILYNFNTTTGVYNYVGRINFNIPNTAATTHTYRYIRAIDTGVSGWKIFIGTTGSVLINGGLFLINSLALSDFIPIGFPTIGFATGNNQKAVYNLQDPSNIGAGNLMTAVAGGVIDGNDIYMHNGVSATHQYHRFDASIAPTYSTATVTITIATPGVVTYNSHPYSNNDQVVLSTTGALPTGLVAGTVYFVRNAAANTFELSATSGGASINTTGAQSGTHTIGRAFGITGSNFVLKTGNLPALSGTLLVTDNERIVIPQHTSMSGSKVVTLATNTTLYMGLVSELTNGATTWPSLQSSNAIGGATEYTAITPSQLVFADGGVDRFVYTSNTSIFYAKQLVNNVVTQRFGQLNTDYLETNNSIAPECGLVTIVGSDFLNGWLFIVGSTVGQRGILAYDLKSHDSFDFSYLVTKVLTLSNSTIRSITPLLERLNSNSSPEFGCYYRTSGFGSITGGWTQVTLRNRINLGVASQIQFKISFRTSRPFTTNPGGIQELLLELLDNNELSSNWVGSNDNTVSTSPAYSAFRLIKAYDTSVPTLYFRAYDDSGTLVASANTSANPTLFQYSTNNGTSWIPLGTIPNTVSTTEIRYAWNTPPGTRVQVSIRES